MDKLLIDPLPEEIRKHVFKVPGFWITDVAASVYKRAFAVVSMECHSPIIAFANRTPAFYIRQKEDTIKGQMYYDIGLSEWVFEIDEVDGEGIFGELKALIDDTGIGRTRLETAYEIINSQYDKSFEIIKEMI